MKIKNYSFFSYIFPMERIIIVVLCLAASFSTLYGQEFSNYEVSIPNMPYLSPEAASLGKYGEIPVSEYTGVPQLEIPLHTIKSGNIELPISLSYHASGIKVNQEATWVGLGWDLMAGGCINRLVSGEYDENISSSVSWEDRKGLFDEYSGSEPCSDIICGYIQGGREGYWTPFMLSELSRKKYEPDIFTANFCGHSLQFYIHPHSQEPIIIGKESGNYIIKKYPENGRIREWSITDNKGTVYYFGEQGAEISSTHSGETTYISSWFITKIKDAVKGEIDLIYSDSLFRIHTIPPLSESLTESEDIGIHNSVVTGRDFYPSGTGTHIPTIPNTVQSSIQHYDACLDKRYLKKIITENSYVEFCISGGRMDISGDSRKLDSIRIKSITGDGTIKRTISFDYSYFHGTQGGPDNPLYNPYVAGETKYYRLKLDSLSINDQRYIFTYDNTILLPKKTSYSQDFWGYYNGQPNKSLLCTANIRERCTNPTAKVLGDANRFVGADFIQAGMLTSVCYPTGGCSEFEFEPNTFVDQHYNEWYPLANQVTSTISSFQTTHEAICSQFSEETDNTKHFEISEPTNVTLSFSVRVADSETEIHKAFALLRQVRPAIGDTLTLHTFFIPEDYGNNNRFQFEMDTLLSNGIYEIQAGFRETPYQGDWDEETHSTLKASYIEEETSFQTTYDGVSYGGGLRIKAIRNYDENHHLIATTLYDYSLDDGTTSGLIMLPPPRVDNDIAYTKGSSIIPGEQTSFFYEWHTSSIASAADVNVFTSINSVPVGYSRVTVLKNGCKTVSLFYNQPPTCYSHEKKTPAYGNLMNGFIREKKLYDRDGELYQIQKWDYEMLVDSSTTVNAYVKDFAMGAVLSLEDWQLALFDRYRLIVYPFLTQRIVPRQEVTKIRYGEEFVCDTVSYSYNNDYLPSVIRKTTEYPGIYQTFNITYPHDHASAICDTMINRNMMAIPIETFEKIGGQTIARSRNVYSLVGRGKPVITSRQWAQGNTPYQDRLTLRYDDNGNHIEAMLSDGKPICFLWAYGNTLPVARVEGINYDNLTAMLPDDFVSALAESNNPENFLSILRNVLNGQDVLIYTFTYDPIFGLLTESAPNGNTVSYEYDSYGRLLNAKDLNGNTTNRYEYHVKP